MSLVRKVLRPLVSCLDMPLRHGAGHPESACADTLECMRLFAAIPLSPTAVERLTRLRLRLSAPGDGLRWSTPEQWHITLQFYGEVERDLAVCLEQRLNLVANSIVRPAIVVEKLEMFDAKGILFASVRLTPELSSLHQRVLEIGNACGVESESRPFRPHVTLARSKGKTGIKALHRMRTPNLPSLGGEISWEADEIVLIESTLCPQGAEYELKGAIPLAMNPVHDQPRQAP